MEPALLSVRWNSMPFHTSFGLIEYRGANPSGVCRMRRFLPSSRAPQPTLDRGGCGGRSMVVTEKRYTFVYLKNCAGQLYINQTGARCVVINLRTLAVLGTTPFPPHHIPLRSKSPCPPPRIQPRRHERHPRLHVHLLQSPLPAILALLLTPLHPPCPHRRQMMAFTAGGSTFCSRTLRATSHSSASCLLI